MKRKRPTQAKRFERQGLLAIDPKAFFELFMIGGDPRVPERVGNVDVIEISGPLVQRDEMWCDSYESIRERVRLACEGDAQAIVMRFDSPGGDASGCFEAARAIREDCAKANKRLYAYVDKACSAAYALASAANGIAIGETCCAGSVGVIASRPDYTAMNARDGLRMAFVVSGTRKLDGNPDVPITEAELVRTQKHVDDLAGKFFALIGDMRPRLPAAQVAAFDGGVFYGAGAVEAGLADAVATFDELLAIASNGDDMTKLLAKSDYEIARASLEKVAKGEDANAAAAKKALAALGEASGGDEGDDDTEPPAAPAEEPGAAEPDDDEPDAEESDDDEPDAAGDPPAPAANDEPADDTKKPKSIAARSVSAQVSLAAQVHTLRAEMAADKDRRVRRRLIASRPDFAPEMKAALKNAPLSTVRELAKTLPRGKVAKPKAITTIGTRGETQGPTGDVSARTSDAEDMDLRMGLSGQKLGCRKEGSTLYFGVMRADNAKPTPGGSAA